jgi:diguanylate cyclase (GGDEF)-like protein/PAS domain S-box-containing protein
MTGIASPATMAAASITSLKELGDRLGAVAIGSGAPDLAFLLGDIEVPSLLDQLPDYVSIKDRQGRFVFCNKAICDAAGLGGDAVLLGKTDADIHDAKTAARLVRLDHRVIATGLPVEKQEERIRLFDGRMLWLSISKAALRDAEGRVVGIISVSRDISERKLQEELRHGHARLLEMIARGRPLDVVLEALVTLAEAQLDDVKGSVTLLSEDGRRLTGGAAPSLPRAYVSLIDGLEIGPASGSCGTAAWRGSPVFVSDVQVDPLWNGRRELGSIFGFRSCWSTPIIGAEARVLGTVALYSATKREPTPLELELMAMATDLAGIAIERANIERRIHHMAHHDPLTGLPNRALFWGQFAAMLDDVRNEAGTATVAYLDLDNFKQINDTFGHAAGDEVLKVMAARMSRCRRPGDLLVRLGGDEFAFVFRNPTHDEHGALRRLEELRDLLSQPIALGEENVVATCSLGAAVFPADGRAPDELLAAADRAMYEAKGLGRDRLSLSP